MIEANRIFLKQHQNDGPSIELGSSASVDVWLAANEQLRAWAKAASKTAGMEVQYRVTFLDGKQLAGIITIQRNSKPDLAGHLRSLIDSKSGDPLPAWTPSWLVGVMLLTRSDKEQRYSQLKYSYRIGPSSRVKGRERRD